MLFMIWNISVLGYVMKDGEGNHQNAQFLYGEMIYKVRERLSDDCSEQRERGHLGFIEL